MAPPANSKTTQFQSQSTSNTMAIRRNEPSSGNCLKIEDFRDSWEESTRQYAAQLRELKRREYNLYSITTPSYAWEGASTWHERTSTSNTASTKESGATSSKLVASTSKLATSTSKAAAATRKSTSKAAVSTSKAAVSTSKAAASTSKAAASTSKSDKSTRKSGKSTRKWRPATLKAAAFRRKQSVSGKIIVNKFHATNLSLSLLELERKPPTVLDTSAVAALETSRHAAKYLPQEPATYGVLTVNSIPMAKTEPTIEVSSDDDDSETDSQSEQYVVESLYVKDTEEKEPTQQSRDIRLLPTDYTPEDGDDDDGSSEYYTPKCILSPSLFPCVPPYLNFSSHATKGPPMPLALHNVLKWKLSPVMPKIVRCVVLNSGFRIIRQTTDWMAVWEKHMTHTGFRTIRSHQKYNHLPGTFCIGRKDSLWRSVRENIDNFGIKNFGIMQKSYILPEDLKKLRRVWARNVAAQPTWICKPPASARGTGIRIINRWSQLPRDRTLVVQRYIERPLLIQGNKFDMRLYVLITSVNPLRIFMYKDGLARFASVKYSSAPTSLSDRCMHLTNYSINKYSESYSRNEDINACQGHKWTLQSLWVCLENRGVNTKRLWATLRNLVIKAIISGEPVLTRMYRQYVNFRYNCFELFGFDVLLDEDIVPWLLEVNISPSLHSDLPLDLHVKGPLVQAVLNTALYQVPPAKLDEQQERAILEELNLDCEQLCQDKRIFTMCLLKAEMQKHSMYSLLTTDRQGYLTDILHNLTSDDVRCLIIAEDELARSEPLERIFPTADTHEYLKFLNCYCYYNRLLDAWEHRYENDREKGRDLLKMMTKNLYHQIVSPEYEEKDPKMKLTQIDRFREKQNAPNCTPIVRDDDL